MQSNYLGNINDNNFILNDYADTCANCACMCPKPRKYNQVCIEKDYNEAIKETAKNILFLPYLIYKQRKVVFAKIKQFFELF